MRLASGQRRHVFVDLVVTQRGFGLAYILKTVVLNKGGKGGVGRIDVELKWLRAPHISHRGVLQR